MRLVLNITAEMSKWTPTPVDKDYVRWLDKKAYARDTPQNGKGDDQRPFNKRKFDDGYNSIAWHKEEEISCMTEEGEG